MRQSTQDIAVQSISDETRSRLDTLRAYARLSFGSLIDDAVEALWTDYLSEGHELTASTEAA